MFKISSIFNFKGRATRCEFCIRYAMIISITVIIMSFNYAATYDYITLMKMFELYHPLAMIFLSAATARRLHDLDYSGHWGWLVYIVFPVLCVAAYFMGSIFMWGGVSSVGWIFFVIAAGVFILYVFSFLFLSIKRGTIGPNKYGNDPLQTTTIETQS